MNRITQLFIGFVLLALATLSLSADEQAVLIEFPISGKMGTKDELKRIFSLEEELEKAIKTFGVGEFDGNEIGEGRCVLFMYGPSAKKLYKAIEPVLRKSPLTKGGVVRLRSGPPGSKEERIKL
jgi:hypothetical protein